MATLKSASAARANICICIASSRSILSMSIFGSRAARSITEINAVESVEVPNGSRLLTLLKSRTLLFIVVSREVACRPSRRNRNASLECNRHSVQARRAGRYTGPCDPIRPAGWCQAHSWRHLDARIVGIALRARLVVRIHLGLSIRTGEVTRVEATAVTHSAVFRKYLIQEVTQLTSLLDGEPVAFHVELANVTGEVLRVGLPFCDRIAIAQQPAGILEISTHAAFPLRASLIGF